MSEKHTKHSTGERDGKVEDNLEKTAQGRVVWQGTVSSLCFSMNQRKRRTDGVKLNVPLDT